MAAGLGFKTFATGDVLTATDTNGYLMQGVWVFANATARDAAVTSPQEGNTCYLKDTDVIQVYSGSSWVTKSGSPSPLTTKGDVYTYSTTDARLAVGTNGQVLTADSAEATGLKWATASSGPTGWSLLNSSGTALTGAATITVSSISAKQLMILVDRASSVNAYADYRITFNSDTANNYLNFGIYNNVGSTYAAGNYDAIQTTADNRIQLAQIGDVAGGVVSGFVYLDLADTTGWKSFRSASSADATGGGVNFQQFTTGGIYKASAAITSVSIYSSGGNFDNGTIYIYGAN